MDSLRAPKEAEGSEEGLPGSQGQGADVQTFRQAFTVVQSLPTGLVD